MMKGREDELGSVGWARSGSIEQNFYPNSENAASQLKFMEKGSVSRNFFVHVMFEFVCNSTKQNL